MCLTMLLHQLIEGTGMASASFEFKPGSHLSSFKIFQSVKRLCHNLSS